MNCRIIIQNLHILSCRKKLLRDFSRLVAVVGSKEGAVGNKEGVVGIKGGSKEEVIKTYLN